MDRHGDYQIIGTLRADPEHPLLRSAGTQHCHHCGYESQLLGHPEQNPPLHPEAGDYNVCSGCGAVARFVVGSHGLALRPATPDEIIEFDRDFPADRERAAQLRHLHRHDQAHRDGADG